MAVQVIDSEDIRFQKIFALCEWYKSIDNNESSSKLVDIEIK